MKIQTHTLWAGLQTRLQQLLESVAASKKKPKKIRTTKFSKSAPIAELSAPICAVTVYRTQHFDFDHLKAIKSKTIEMLIFNCPEVFV